MWDRCGEGEIDSHALPHSTNRHLGAHPGLHILAHSHPGSQPCAINQQVPCRCRRYSKVATGAGACTSAFISHRFAPFPFPSPPLDVLHPTHRPWLAAAKPHCVLGTCASVFASPRFPLTPSFTPPLSAPRPLLHSSSRPSPSPTHPPAVGGGSPATKCMVACMSCPPAPPCPPYPPRPSHQPRAVAARPHHPWMLAHQC